MRNRNIGKHPRDSGTELKHGFLGEMMKGHKYVAREENDNGSKNKYRYFYTEEAWDAFKNAKSSLVEKASSFASGVLSSAQKGFQKLSGLLKGGDGSKSVSDIKNENKENARSVHKTMRFINELAAKLDGVFGKGYKKVNPTARYTDKNGDIVTGHNGSTDEKGHKYVGKIRMPPQNKWRYYYTESAFQSAIATYNYRTADDHYMDQFDTLDHGYSGNKASKQGDFVNPGHKKAGDYRGINCIYCTLATELRTRGYDVQAKDIPSVDNRNTLATTFGLDRPTKTESFSISVSPDYKGSEYNGAKKEGSKTVVTRTLTNTDHIKDLVPAAYDPDIEIREDGSMKMNAYKVTRDMTKELESSFPPGARGNLSIYWNGGGGHSEFWEIDDKGKLHIYDTQSGTEMNEDSLRALVECADPTEAIEFMRFDDCAIVDPTIIKDSIESTNKSKSK